MIGKTNRQVELFIPGDIGDFVPEDHILKRVDKVLDLSWLEGEVASLYCANNGRASIPPEAAVRLMLAGFYSGITQDRKLMREAQVNLAIRWFAGYGLSDALPHHSSLTRIRQRWGEDTFRRIFTRTVDACGAAGLIGGDTVHIDATLIRANVSWESLAERWADAALADNTTDDTPPHCPDRWKARKKSNKKHGRTRVHQKQPKKYSRTDPDATLTTSKKGFRMEPSFKQHTVVDDAAGVIVDVAVTTGEASEGERLMQTIERVESNTGQPVTRVTADGAYAHSANYAALEERAIDAVIPPQKVGRTGSGMPSSRFKYDAKHKLVRCPHGKKLTRRNRVNNGWAYRGSPDTCGCCPHRTACVPSSAKVRTILIVDGYEALLRARRRRARWDSETIDWYKRHRWRVEGVHGEAKQQHGLHRAARRGMANVTIQAYLTAAVINLKRLAAALMRVLMSQNAYFVVFFASSRQFRHSAGLVLIFDYLSNCENITFESAA
jgi:transposase